MMNALRRIAVTSMIAGLSPFRRKPRPNLELIHFVRDYLEGLGAECRLTYDDEKRKANLFATLGPGGAPGIVLSGHTDVVPVDGQAWATNPFEVVEKEGRLYGRGTSDMKSFIAVALALAPEFVERGLKTPHTSRALRRGTAVRGGV